MVSIISSMTAMSDMKFHMQICFRNVIKRETVKILCECSFVLKNNVVFLKFLMHTQMFEKYSFFFSFK